MAIMLDHPWQSPYYTVLPYCVIGTVDPQTLNIWLLGLSELETNVANLDCLKKVKPGLTSEYGIRKSTGKREFCHNRQFGP